MPYAYNDNFASSLPIWIPFLSFSCLTAVRIFNTMLNRRGQSEHPCLAPGSSTQAFSFTTEYYAGRK